MWKNVIHTLNINPDFNAYHAYHLKSIMLYQPHINLAPVLTSRWVKQLSIDLSLFVARQKSLTHPPLEKNGHRFADDIFKCIFMTEKLCILIRISVKFVSKCLIDNIPTSVLVMAWRLTRDKSLYEPMMTQFLTHICGTRGRCVNQSISRVQGCLKI